MFASMIIGHVAASSPTAAGISGGGDRTRVSTRYSSSRQRRHSLPLSFIVKKRHPKHCPPSSQIIIDKSSSPLSSSVSLGFWLRREDDVYVDFGSNNDSTTQQPPVHAISNDEKTADASLENNNTIANNNLSADSATTATAATGEDKQNICVTNQKTSRWKRLSSVSNALILPGTPLFLRLLPVKPNEVISKIIDEMPLPPSSSRNQEEDEEEMTQETTTALALFDAPPKELRQLILSAPKNVDAIVVNGSVKSSHEEKTEEEDEVQVPPPQQDPTPTTVESNGKKNDPAKEEGGGSKKKFGPFHRSNKRSSSSSNKKNNTKGSTISKDELQCPAIVTNIHEMREAVLINRTSLKDVGFRFPLQGIGSDIVFENGPTTAPLFSKRTKFQRYDPIVNGTLSSLLNCKTASAKNKSDYQLGIELINQHNVLEQLLIFLTRSIRCMDRVPERL